MMYCSMAPPPRANLTGFDVRKLVQASRMPANDPWARALVLHRCRTTRSTANGYFAESNGGIQVHLRGGIGLKVLFQALV